MFYRELPKIRSKSNHFEAQSKTNSPTPLEVVILASSLQILIKGTSPVSNIMGTHILVMLIVPELLLGFRHSDGKIQGLCNIIHIPRIDPNGTTERRRATDEL